MTGRRGLLLTLRVAISVGGLVLILWHLGVADVAAQFDDLQPGWLVPIFALTVLQMGLSAWRWQFTAARLAVPIEWRRAVGEYYLAAFFNQILPGGVMGDVARAWRHGTRRASLRSAVLAVVLERTSGQLALALIAVAALAMADGLPGWLLPVAAALLALCALFVALTVRRRAGGVIHRALLDRTVLPLQLVSSFVVVATYIGVYVLTGWVIGVERPLHQWLPLVPLVLVAMAVPLSVAGWGLREGAAAIIWSMAGLPAAEAVALSVAYGLINLAAASPGLLVAVLAYQGSRATSATSAR